MLSLENASEKEKEFIENFLKLKSQKDIQTMAEKLNQYEDAYYNKKLGALFLSIAEELLLCLKEELMKELLIISVNSRKGKGSKAKEEIFSHTFGKFQNCKIKVCMVI